MAEMLSFWFMTGLGVGFALAALVDTIAFIVRLGMAAASAALPGR